MGRLVFLPPHSATYNVVRVRCCYYSVLLPVRSVDAVYATGVSDAPAARTVRVDVAGQRVTLPPRYRGVCVWRAVRWLYCTFPLPVGIPLQRLPHRSPTPRPAQHSPPAVPFIPLCCSFVQYCRLTIAALPFLPVRTYDCLHAVLPYGVHFQLPPTVLLLPPPRL